MRYRSCAYASPSPGAPSAATSSSSIAAPDDAHPFVPRVGVAEQCGETRQVGELHLGARRVVRVERARRSHLAGIEERDPATEERLHALAWHAAQPQDRRFAARAVDDRRLDADATRPAVEDHVDVVAEIGEHVGGGGGAHATEPVGRRCRHPTAERAQQRERERLVGDPQADGVEAAGHRVAHVR